MLNIYYKKFLRIHRDDVGEFFVQETKDILDKLYEDFEEVIENSN